MENYFSSAGESTNSTAADTHNEKLADGLYAGVPQPQERDSAAFAPSDADGGVAQEQNAEIEPFLEIRYNHQNKRLSKEQAVKLAQMGMHFEGTHKALERIAAIKGQTPLEFLQQAEAEEESAHRRALIEKFGEDGETVDALMELYALKKQAKISAVQTKEAQQESETGAEARIKAEFLAMQKGDFPELCDFSQLPNQVKEAAQNGMPLDRAYLLYKYNEQRKIEAERRSSELAEKRSAGSLSGDCSDSDSQDSIKYLNALWHK